MYFNRIYFIFGLLLFNLNSFSQTASVDIVSFNSTASYGPGSGVSVHINPTGIYKFKNETDDNQFILELSDSGGLFASSPTVLTIIDGFFTTTINGVLDGVEPEDYKLRVRATKAFTGFDPLTGEPVFGEILSDESDVFTVVDSPILPSITTYSKFVNNGEIFDCTDEDEFSSDAMFGYLFAQSNTTSGYIPNIRRRISISNFNELDDASYKLKRIDVINDVVVDLGDITTENYSISDDLPLGTYNYELEFIDVSGFSSIYTIVFVLHKSTTTLANDSGERVCRGSDVIFNIDNSSDGIADNYRGSYYTIDYGDGTDLEIYTHAEILFNNTLSHVFNDISCGINPDFEVIKQMFNKYKTSNSDNCDYKNIGNGVIKMINSS